VGAAGALGDAVPARGPEQPAANDQGRGAARRDRRPRGADTGRQQAGDRDSDRPRRPAEARVATAAVAPAAVAHPQGRVRTRCPRSPPPGREPARPRDGQAGCARGRGAVPARARERAPGGADQGDVHPALPVPVAWRARPRLRRRDQLRPAQAAAQARLRARRQARAGRRRGDLRHVPPRPAGPRPAPRRLDGTAAVVRDPDARAEARLLAPADDRHPGPARGGAGAPRGDRVRAHPGLQGVLDGERGCDRRARPAQRRDPRARVESDVPAPRLRGCAEPARACATDEPEEGRGGELPRGRPCHAGSLSAGLDVQAGDGAGRDAGARPVALFDAAGTGRSSATGCRWTPR
jgi:hypothetical protein